MRWHTGLNQLHAVCTELYDTVDDARRLADQSGLERARINFQGSTANIWHSMLLEAERCRGVPALIDAIYADYPNYAPLQAAHQRYSQTRAPSVALQTRDGEEAALADDLDDATTRRISDEAAVAPSILGHLQRVTQRFNLPSTLPIYQLESDSAVRRYLRVGRNRVCNTLVLADRSVSREHALLAQTAGQLYLRDNASTLGTFLNWRRLHDDEELLVHNGDLIGFGAIVYEFVAGNERGNQAAAM